MLGWEKQKVPVRYSIHQTQLERVRLTDTKNLWNNPFEKLDGFQLHDTVLELGEEKAQGVARIATPSKYLPHLTHEANESLVTELRGLTGHDYETPWY